MIQTTVTKHVEVTVSFDGTPMQSPVPYSAWLTDDTDREATIASAVASARDYIHAGVQAGNDRSRYGIVQREVVTVTTDWQAS